MHTRLESYKRESVAGQGSVSTAAAGAHQAGVKPTKQRQQGALASGIAAHLRVLRRGGAALPQHDGLRRPPAVILLMAHRVVVLSPVIADVDRRRSVCKVLKRV